MDDMDDEREPQTAGAKQASRVDEARELAYERERWDRAVTRWQNGDGSEIKAILEESDRDTEEVFKMCAAFGIGSEGSANA